MQKERESCYVLIHFPYAHNGWQTAAGSWELNPSLTGAIASCFPEDCFNGQLAAGPGAEDAIQALHYPIHV